MNNWKERRDLSTAFRSDVSSDLWRSIFLYCSAFTRTNIYFTQTRCWGLETVTKSKRKRWKHIFICGSFWCWELMPVAFFHLLKLQETCECLPWIWLGHAFRNFNFDSHRRLPHRTNAQNVSESVKGWERKFLWLHITSLCLDVEKWYCCSFWVSVSTVWISLGAVTYLVRARICDRFQLIF